MILLRDSRIGETCTRIMTQTDSQTTMGLQTKVAGKVVSLRVKNETAK